MAETTAPATAGTPLNGRTMGSGGNSSPATKVNGQLQSDPAQVNLLQQSQHRPAVLMPLENS